MKTFCTLIICAVVFCSNSIYCQQDSSKKENAGCAFTYILKTDILMPAISLISKGINTHYGNNAYIESLTFEACYNDRQSVQMTAQFFNYGSALGVEIIPEIKYFVQTNNPYTGFYTGMGFKYLVNRYTEHFYEPAHHESDIGIGVELIGGYQNKITEHFVYDILVGFGTTNILYSTSNFYYQKSSGDAFYEGRFAINLGYKF